MSNRGEPILNPSFLRQTGTVPEMHAGLGAILSDQGKRDGSSSPWAEDENLWPSGLPSNFRS